MSSRRLGIDPVLNHRGLRLRRLPIEQIEWDALPVDARGKRRVRGDGGGRRTRERAGHRGALGRRWWNLARRDNLSGCGGAWRGRCCCGEWWCWRGKRRCGRGWRSGIARDDEQPHNDKPTAQIQMVIHPSSFFDGAPAWRIGQLHYIESEQNCKRLPRARICVILAGMTAPDFFIPDCDPHAFYPLRDFLRAPPVSVAEQYIVALTAPGDLVLDPFGASPNVARAAHAHDRRAIVSESNPLWAWLARAMATLPPASEIDVALTRLGDTLKDDMPLRAHMQQLYTTVCAACNQPTPADYFIRTRAGGLVARHYTCAHCGVTRHDPATEDDWRRANAIAARGIHYHFAFGRVAPAEGAFVERIRRLLDLYTPRNLSALATLTQKIEARFHAAHERAVLLLLLLHALERGAAFFAAPTAAPQLLPHPQFVEFNLWQQIERAARALADHSGALDCAASPREVSNAAARVFIGHGNAKTLAHALPRASVALVLTAPPTRRAAVWALTYFWGAWVLGRAAAQSLAPFLDTRKDAAWERRWYADALDDALQQLAPCLRADARVVCVFDETWHPSIEALLLAAAGARLQLEAFVFQTRLGDVPRREFDDVRASYRLAFVRAPTERRAPMEPRPLESKMRAAALAAASEILARRGEALPFTLVHHAALARLAREGLLAEAVAQFKLAAGRVAHQAIRAGLQEGYAHDFDHYASAEQFVWLRRSHALAAPLIDRVEEAVRTLLARGVAAREELCAALYRQFAGDLTPEAGLIELCAAAYAEPMAEAERLRARDALARLGERLGYTTLFDFRFSIFDSIENRAASENFDVVWQADGDLAHAFVWRAAAQFTDLAQVQIAPRRGYVIVPENFAALMQEKTRRLPHLAEAFYEAGWNFVRVPMVERLLARDTLERGDEVLMAGLLPPLASERAQLELL